MKPKALKKLGIPKGNALQAATHAVMKARASGTGKQDVINLVKALVNNPEAMKNDRIFGKTAKLMTETRSKQQAPGPAKKGVPYTQWGSDIEDGAIRQMENACSLPVSVKGALMPDAHQGYGLPIGGVLAVDNAVIPYAVGMDIACRMRLSVIDFPLSCLSEDKKRMRYAIESGTSFGLGTISSKRHQHSVMDEDWKFSKLISSLKDRAWSQLGTSGSGNHFVEFGVLVLEKPDLGLSPGSYPALLSHSGSRGTGAAIAEHYSRIATKRQIGLPRFLSKLAWLDLKSNPGIEYWKSMELMGKYAAANHELIHLSVISRLGARVLATVENHHNYAWKETHSGKQVIVHRKGATPAGKDDVGIIPGTMASPGYVVRGLGNRASLNSAAHGAGRRLSRKAAKKRYTHNDMNQIMKQKNIELISAGLDEIPMAYKDINEVMAAQSDLVSIIARFNPKIVKMAN